MTLGDSKPDRSDKYISFQPLFCKRKSSLVSSLWCGSFTHLFILLALSAFLTHGTPEVWSLVARLGSTRMGDGRGDKIDIQACVSDHHYFNRAINITQHFRRMVDDHVITVIAADLIFFIIPYTTCVLSINIG